MALGKGAHLQEITTRSVIESFRSGQGQKLHWFPENVDRKTLAEVMTGMANSGGGSIILGISSQSNRLIGIREPGVVIDRVFQAALEIVPTLVFPIPENVEEDGKQFIWLDIPEGLPHVYSLDGRYLHRTGSATNLIPAKQLRMLLVERGIVQFEAKLPDGASLSDLDKNLIDDYRHILNAETGEDGYGFLIRRSCLQRTDAGMKPTYAGLLLFGTTPQQWLPSASVLAVRFTGTTFSDSFVKQEITGNLIHQLRMAEAFIREHTPKKGMISGMQRVDEDIYPIDVVRELIVNAITHRDYNHQGDHIHVQIYSDRLIVRSPGELPGPVTLENILDVRFSRNPIIAQVLSDFGYVERFGYGLNRVMRSLLSKGFQRPGFREIGGCFEVSVSAQINDKAQVPRSYPVAVNDSLNDRQLSALEYLGRNSRITNRAYQQLCPDVSPETLRRDLVDLVRQGMLLKIGSKRSTYYILKKKP